MLMTFVAVGAFALVFGVILSIMRIKMKIDKFIAKAVSTFLGWLGIIGVLLVSNGYFSDSAIDMHNLKADYMSIYSDIVSDTSMSKSDKIKKLEDLKTRVDDFNSSVKKFEKTCYLWCFGDYKHSGDLVIDYDILPDGTLTINIANTN